MTDSQANKPDSEDTENQVDQPVATAAVAVTAETPRRGKSESGSSSSAIAILFSLLALAGSGFTWYQTQVVNVQSESVLAVGVSEIGGQVARLGDSISRIQTQQDTAVTGDQLGSRLAQFDSKLQSSLKSIGDRQTGIDESINKINNDMQKGVSAYLLDEVSQLLKMASYSVAFTNDAGSALNALKLADGQLKNLSDPRYAIVRKKINEEIALLNNARQADIEAISASLTSISSTIPELPLANEPESAVASFKQETVTTELSWRTELAKAWEDLKGSIQVQRVDQPPKPLLAPGQRYFLNQNLQLNIAKAEIALLQQRPQIFQQALQSAVVWLKDYFDTSDQRVASIIQQLQALQKEDLDSTLPAITGSYDALQTVKGG